MFYIHHHDDQVSLFNANCRKAVLVAHILLTLKLHPKAVIDLLPYPLDSKVTTPVGIQEKADDVYCDTFLTLRGKYILIQTKESLNMIKSETENPLGYEITPLLTTVTPVPTFVGVNKEMVLIWKNPNKPEETDRISQMLASRYLDPKKTTMKKVNKK
eukprot:Tbor_TRINITY_DN4181_c0_g2::TRINITY_DN4181_c0_g2_i1::g.26537::m.26537